MPIRIHDTIHDKRRLTGPQLRSRKTGRHNRKQSGLYPVRREPVGDSAEPFEVAGDEYRMWVARVLKCSDGK
jgi:hypothetical protein